MTLFESILRPISQRLATAAGSALTALGMAAADANVVASAIPVILGFAVDLVIRRFY